MTTLADSRRALATARPAWPDAPVLAAAVVQGAVIAAALSFAAHAGIAGRLLAVAVIAAGICWGSNTISHIHLHRPLFRRTAANQLLSLYLGLVLLVPQRWWKLRHLAHHGLLGGAGRAGAADRDPAARLGVGGALEVAVLLAALALLGVGAPDLLAGVVAPAWMVGIALCAAQGHGEHARAASGVDHHGRLYNRLWFNDGFHAAHHRNPAAHWSELPTGALPTDATSPLPPVLRWLERLPSGANRLVAATIDVLERLTLHSRAVRAFLVASHRRAFERLLAPERRALIRTVTVVGGGLFPRSVLVLAPLLPGARFHVVERAARHVVPARALLGRLGLADRVTFEVGEHRAGTPVACDLLVLPLAFRGDRRRCYDHPPAPLVAVHDWIWRRSQRGPAFSARVSLLLLKRLNLVAAG